MGKGEYDRIMIVPKITTVANPQNITFRKFEHNEELFKKLPPYRTKTADKPTGEEQNGHKRTSSIRTVYCNSCDVFGTK